MEVLGPSSEGQKAPTTRSHELVLVGVEKREVTAFEVFALRVEVKQGGVVVGRNIDFVNMRIPILVVLLAGHFPHVMLPVSLEPCEQTARLEEHWANFSLSPLGQAEVLDDSETGPLDEMANKRGALATEPPFQEPWTHGQRSLATAVEHAMHAHDAMAANVATLLGRCEPVDHATDPLRRGVLVKVAVQRQGSTGVSVKLVVQDRWQWCWPNARFHQFLAGGCHDLLTLAVAHMFGHQQPLYALGVFHGSLTTRILIVRCVLLPDLVPIPWRHGALSC
mmetsp:Transcript_97978/g.277115  ORF Transcript_97978/g.277115 Transcript_97978/m.277115 type:complete len:279 (+) Transcript_97978:161-997(+)